MKRLKAFFQPIQTFDEKEWLRKEQIFAMLIVSFFVGIGVLAFAPVRLMQGNTTVGLSQLFLGLFMLSGFFILKREKRYYDFYAFTFLVLFFIYTWIIFFLVPQNSLNILWVISAPILIFFFLNKKGGIAIFVLLTLFILYLIMSGYPYNPAEFITLIGAFLTTTFVMYRYESVKEAEQKRLLAYTQKLGSEVEKKTAELKAINETLHQKVEKEVAKRLEQERMLVHRYRMAQLGQMSDAVAHQWRQPLMRINAHLLQIQTAIEQERIHRAFLEKEIDEISTLTVQMSQTLHEFRCLFDRSMHPTKFSLVALFDEVKALLAYRLKRIEVVTISSPAHEIYAVKNLLLQVLVVLVVNAIEALESNATADAKIILKSQRDKKATRVVVEDNARGVLHTSPDKLFDLYYTTKKHSGGTGMGLYIAKLIMQKQCKGDIVAEQADEGLRFVLTIPHHYDSLRS